MRKNKNIITIKYKGGLYTLKELSEKTGVRIDTLRRRNYLGLKDDELTATIKTGRRSSYYSTYNGEEVTLKELSEKTGINMNTLRYRIKSGMKGCDLIKPVK